MLPLMNGLKWKSEHHKQVNECGDGKNLMKIMYMWVEISLLASRLCILFIRTSCLYNLGNFGVSSFK